jgi:hypothetical protein
VIELERSSWSNGSNGRSFNVTVPDWSYWLNGEVPYYETG